MKIVGQWDSIIQLNNIKLRYLHCCVGIISAGSIFSNISLLSKIQDTRDTRGLFHASHASLQKTYNLGLH